MDRKPRFDWLGFFVHFVCGAIFGGLIGFLALAKSVDVSSMSALQGFYFVGGGALFLGLLAGFLGDGFWESVGGIFH